MVARTPWVYFRNMSGQCVVIIRFLLATIDILCALLETIQERCKTILDLKDLTMVEKSVFFMIIEKRERV